MTATRIANELAAKKNKTQKIAKDRLSAFMQHGLTHRNLLSYLEEPSLAKLASSASLFSQYSKIESCKRALRYLKDFALNNEIADRTYLHSKWLSRINLLNIRKQLAAETKQDGSIYLDAVFPSEKNINYLLNQYENDPVTAFQQLMTLIKIPLIAYLKEITMHRYAPLSLNRLLKIHPSKFDKVIQNMIASIRAQLNHDLFFITSALPDDNEVPHGITREFYHLLNVGADFNALHSYENVADKNYFSAFSLSVLLGKTLAIEEFIKRGADVNAIVLYQYFMRKNHLSMLALAIEKGHEQVARLLIDSGVNVNGIGILHSANQEKRPIICAIERGNTEIVKLLIEKGADVNFSELYIGTPLNYAAWHGEVEVVKVLLASGKVLDIDAIEIHSGYTPLMQAVEMGYPEIVEALIDAGADLKILNYGNCTAFEMASMTLEDFESEELENLKNDEDSDNESTMSTDTVHARDDSDNESTTSNDTVHGYNEDTERARENMPRIVELLKAAQKGNKLGF